MEILWIDDEIDLLKPHVIFLEKKGYKLTTMNNAADALEIIPQKTFQAVLIDENMPGIGGLEALQKIKQIRPNLPVIMVTKNEEEHIMEEAIGAHISDYLIKPVNPNQVLLSLKKILESRKIVSEKTLTQYQQEFRQISMDLMNAYTYQDWAEVYKKLVYWELELDDVQDETMQNILNDQKEQANTDFFKFIEKNYIDWFHDNEGKPTLSHTAFHHFVRPELGEQKTILLMIDNLRYDQWRVIEPLFQEYYNLKSEESYYSILPTATQYARNSFFAGLLPLEIEKRFPDKWLNDPDEGNKNQFEFDFLQDQLARLGLKDFKTKYYKILNSDFEKRVLDEFHDFKSNDLTVIVYNFIDILSHAKTDNRVVSELIRDDKTYRSMTRNWFENSYLLRIVREAAQQGMKLLITTDHGTIFVRKASKVIGDRETSTNLRYKLGRQLQYNERDVLAIDNPEEIYLPKVNVSSSYIFAKEDLFLAYPKNYNHYVNYYTHTYQHGGISLEEMIIPFAVMVPK